MAPGKPITSKILPSRKVFGQLPNRERAFHNASSIITKEHAAEIASLIDKRKVACDVNDIPYKFNLILPSWK